MFKLSRLVTLLVPVLALSLGLSNHAAGQDSSPQLTEAQQLVKRSDELRSAGRYDEALPLAERAVAILEKAYGPENPYTVFSQYHLAVVFAEKRDYPNAELLYQRVIRVMDKVRGSDSLDLILPLRSFAAMYKAKGDYVNAEPLLKRLLAIYEKARGSDHPDVALSLNNLAELYAHNGDYLRAEPLHLRALEIWKKAGGPDHPDVATSLSNLGSLYRAKGDYVLAEPLLKRALEIREKVLPPGDPDIAVSLNNLAVLFAYKGDYVETERLFQRAFDIWEKAPGQQVHLASALNNLAAIYNAKGDDARAEPLYKRALEIREKALDPEHPDIATSLMNLGSLYLEKDDIVRAEPLLNRALEIREKVFGPEHRETAASLRALGLLYKRKGDDVRAEELYKRALQIIEKRMGTEHPDVAFSLNGLATFYHSKGKYALAEPLYLRVVAIEEKVFGPNHPNLAHTLSGLAELYENKGDLAQAVHFWLRAEETQEHNLNLILSSGSESQKQLYLTGLRGVTNGLVSFHVHAAPSDQLAAHLALTAILRRKGRALDAMTDQINTLRQRAGPEDQKLLDQLASVHSQLARLRLSDGDINDSRTTEQRLAQAARLSTESENLQAEISRRSAQFRALTQPVTVEAVRQALPADAALVELFSYQPFSMQRKEADRYDAPRYVAYVLKQKGAITFVDLGPAETIDRAAEQFIDATRNPASVNAKETGRALDEIVTRPIRKLLGDVRNIFISPDGNLNLVPFAALVDEQDKYLVENYTITYLTSGRDLLRLSVPHQSKQTSVIIANPAFDAVLKNVLPNAPDAISPVAGSQSPSNQSRQMPTAGAGSRRSDSMLTSNWGALRGTADEADYLEKLLPDSRVLTGKDATEGALKQVVAPRILHLATHGFFLPNEPLEQQVNAKSFHENPLLRSGLVLAGANNLQGGGGEDGILTALEAAGLNLWGTQLVVLSACETGVGVVRSGEGVYGLRRALVLAGTESQVMTLWKVDDAATSEVIIEYYSRLQKGEGRTEGLRQVQLEFLKRQTRQHPFYWASFILNGDWRSLRAENGSIPTRVH